MMIVDDKLFSGYVYCMWKVLFARTNVFSFSYSQAGFEKEAVDFMKALH
ncbi:hypothetical protein M0G43_14815 [Subsaxibacter sp. CAU 1640]|nr:hypothetical protein [Subsaxibacter sp. CAU 1640]MCK7591856.1 hypothetical protein [Subsaxibacter sp. CAU 1640]